MAMFTGRLKSSHQAERGKHTQFLLFNPWWHFWQQFYEVLHWASSYMNDFISLLWIENVDLSERWRELACKKPWDVKTIDFFQDPDGLVMLTAVHAATGPWRSHRQEILPSPMDAPDKPVSMAEKTWYFTLSTSGFECLPLVNVYKNKVYHAKLWMVMFSKFYLFRCWYNKTVNSA